VALAGGVPLVGWAARTSRLALAKGRLAGRVICSTDSPEIASVAREWGAEVPFPAAGRTRH